jgi:hypothetical protein|tara:strand:+ start:165 stop:344 length:180 start_codon:yes stop_codon:yes gene_type:complete
MKRNKYRYIVYYQKDRDDWRDGTLEANTMEEALSMTHYMYRDTPWTIKRVELMKPHHEK